MKDFYFIYVITGDNYIKSILKGFDYIPEEANVVVITNTPKLLHSYQVKFNLIIEDLEALRSEWSKSNEIVLDIQDEQEYMDKLSEMYKNGYRYPMSIMRYGIKWAVKNNVTKFVITDSGSLINYMYDSRASLKILSNMAINKNKNLIFGSPVILEKIDYFIGTIFEEYINEISKHIPNIDKKDFYDYIDCEYSDSMPEYRYNIRGIGFDGHTYGYWFDEISLVKKLFDLWEDIMIKYYQGSYSKSWAVDFEWIMTVISIVYSRYYNVYPCGHNNIIAHLYRPENDFFASSVKYSNDLSWKEAKTRKEFIIANREKLIEHYGGEERVKDIVYEYDKIINSQA